MDAQIIEKLDKHRYRAVLLETAGLLILTMETLFVYIRTGADPNFLALGAMGIPLLSPGLLLLIAGGIWYGRVWAKAGRDRQLRNSLYNEMYMQNKYRCQRLTMWVMIGLCFVSIFPVMWIITPVYPYIIVTEMIMLAGLLTMKISWLVYNRK